MTRARSASRALRVAPPDVDAAVFDGPAAEVLAPPVPLGHGETGDPVAFDLEVLLETRLLVQGMSGAGKSWLLRRLLETTAGAVQQVVLDPEGEFRSLAERYGHVPLDATRLDAEALGEAAARARRARASLWVDLSQVGRGAQMLAVAAVLNALVTAGDDHWHPCLVAIDEAHLFAPQGGGAVEKDARTASLAAVIDLMSRGRKRGLCGVLATQRLGALARAVASEAGNVLIGLNTQDIDIARAATVIGWPRRKADGILRILRPGHFIAFGPMFTHSPVEVRIGPVTTRHRGATPRLGPPPRRDDGTTIDVEALAAATATRRAALRGGIDPRGAQVLRDFAARPGAAAAMRIYAELLASKPFPRTLTGLVRRLGLDLADCEVALALLERHGLAGPCQSHDGRAAVAL